jgi:short-subunit dehydrogenase
MPTKNWTAVDIPSQQRKTILITGASSGMGKEAAKDLIKQGYIVYTAARRLEQMKDLEELGGFPVKMDISKESDIENTIQTIIEKHKKIDVLWNNAGYGLFGSVEEIPIDEARKQFEVNLFGLANLTQKVIPYMRKAQSGTIINTSSMGGKMYTPLGAWYHATKHALEGWSDCLRLELKQFNINVVILEPGLIATEFGDVLFEPMMKVSGNGPYKAFATSLANAKNASSIEASPTSVISKTILKIVNSPKPQTRYRVGKLAKPLVWMRTYLGDKIFDKLITSQIK